MTRTDPVAAYEDLLTKVDGLLAKVAAKAPLRKQSKGGYDSLTELVEESIKSAETIGHALQSELARRQQDRAEKVATIRHIYHFAQRLLGC